MSDFAPVLLNKAILARLQDQFPNHDNEKPDIVLKGGTIIDTRGGALFVADIAIKQGVITDISKSGFPDDVLEGVDVRHCQGRFISPGFINTHLHIESSLIMPQEYSRMVTPRGTTTIVCDPHEAANVKGTAAFDFWLDSAQESILDIYIGLSSCVPAMTLGASGAAIYAADMKPYIDREGVVGAAEYMDIGGMMSGADKTLDIMALFKGRYIGGHMPGIQDCAMLQTIRNYGVCDDHECTSAGEAAAKLKAGFNIMIREGTAAKNLDALLPIITDENAGRMMFCTDDRHPDEVQDYGEIDYIIRKSIQGYDSALHGADKEAYIIRIYQMATLWAAQNFGFADRGAIEVGMKADVVILDDLATCNIDGVLKDGMSVDASLFAHQKTQDPADYGFYDTIHLKDGAETVSADDFKIMAPPSAVKDAFVNCAIIGLNPGQIVTEYKTHDMAVSAGGEILPSLADDILKIAVIERHGNSGNMGAGFVNGFKMQDGALASSVGHDDHNIIVVGTDDAQMAQAVNKLKESGGGFVFVQSGAVKAVQPLPVCGLMSDLPWEDVADIQRAFLKNAGTKELPDPTMALAFLALGVIPDVKLRVPDSPHPESLTRFAPGKGIDVPKTWNLTNPVL